MTSCGDGTVRLFDRRAGHEDVLQVIRKRIYPVTAVVFDPFRPTHLAVGSDMDLVHVFDLRARPKQEKVNCVIMYICMDVCTLM